MQSRLNVLTICVLILAVASLILHGPATSQADWSDLKWPAPKQVIAQSIAVVDEAGRPRITLSARGIEFWDESRNRIGELLPQR